MNSKIFQIIKLLWGINPLSFGNIRFLTIRKKPMSKKLYKYVFYVVSCFYKTLRVTWYRILSFIFMQTLLCIHGRGGRFTKNRITLYITFWVNPIIFKIMTSFHCKLFKIFLIYCHTAKKLCLESLYNPR